MYGTLLERFEEKFKTGGVNECWLWTASKVNGYGQIVGNGKNLRAHRVSYMMYVGKIPKGLCVLHHCDRPACVNPRHLFLGTLGDNNRDRNEKGRSRKAEWYEDKNGRWRRRRRK